VGIEKWIAAHFKGDTVNNALIKIVVPEEPTDRFEILKTLNRMNINHRSLFPDVEGSARFCNIRLSVTDY